MKRISMLAALLGMLVVAAIGAPAAQAIESEWMIEGVKVAELEGKKETLSLTGGTVTLAVPSAEPSSIECSSSSGSGSISSGGSDEISLTLSECKAPKLKTCKITTPITIKAKSELISTGGATYAKLVPLSEGTFATIVIKECGTLKEGTLKGSLAAEMSFERLEKQPLKFSESLTKEVNKDLNAEKASELSLTFGGATAYLTGEIKAKLSGEKHAGQKWRRVRFTKLCEEQAVVNTTTCPTGQYWPKETELIAAKTVTEMKFELGFTTTVCAGAKLKGKTTSDGATPLEGNLSVAVFEACDNNCEVKRTGSNHYNLITYGDDSGEGIFEIPDLNLEFTCGATICYYQIPVVDIFFVDNETKQFLFGPSPGVNMPRVAPSPGNCAEFGVWGGNGFFAGGFDYKITSPEPTFLTG